ncbi:PREDICTED: dnaJ homolog subfamily C member 11 [Ceratosolen solmsi marchali]|uniref:DnaJ homolog subfamily C member 11 n=1 Tax=Ceratosolen solmsi marchali TaxID=326594 RepID=A0AAJ7DZ54_9HYME|nr:PREDICTED: dnaJ homolog subfamily C member 11 [Ceratosolen solmsi marchali]
MDPSSVEMNPDEDDYYALFNISKTATQEEITNAYRRLSKSYHPDKHMDPHLKKDAEILFSRINKVYEVLNNPNKRAVYDTIGVQGLESNDWELVLRTKNPQEVLKAYEKLQLDKEEQKQLQKANPKGTFGVNINATDLFTTYPVDYDGANVLSSIEVSGMTFTQSVETPLTQKNTAVLGGELSVKNGVGTGAINVAFKRLISPMAWMEVELSAGSWPGLTFKGYKKLSKRIHFSGDVPIKFTPKGIDLSFAGSLSMELNKRTVGYLTYKTGLHSSMSTSIITSTENSQTIITIEFSQLQSFISLHHEHMFLQKKLGLLGYVQIGSSSWTMEYGVKKKLSRNTALSTVVCMDSMMGVSLRIKLKRAYQIYRFSIALSDEVMPAPIFYGTIVPMMGWVLFKNFVMEPLLQQRKKRDKEQRRKEEAEQWLQKKKEAKMAIDLMSVTCSRIRATEEAKRGLVIVKAVYGRFIYDDEKTRHSENFNSFRNEIIDVTIPLQCLVKESNLVLHKGSKSHLTGFYDPCIGEEKFLVIQYLFRMNTHECMVKDNEPLSIPKECHRVIST